jgi:transcriptional regulator with XRE-family HTH domain
VAKTAAPQGDNPWGEAIRYWLKEFKLRQAHIAEATGIPANTISKAARGLDVHQETLRRIADFFQVPHASILVSPERRLSQTEEQQVIKRLTADAQRVIEQRRRIDPVTRRVNPMLMAIAARIEKLDAPLRKSVLDLLASYEKQLKKDSRARKTGGRKSATRS